MDVEEHDVRILLLDQRDGIGDRPGLADDLDRVAELGTDAGEEQAVVVHEHDPPLHDAPSREP